MLVLGFSYETATMLNSNNEIWKFTDFLGTEATINSSSSIWKNTLINDDKHGYMALASALRLFGINGTGSCDDEENGIVSRRIFGNCFARFFIFSFAFPGDYMGQPLMYEEGNSYYAYELVKKGEEGNYTFEDLKNKMKLHSHTREIEFQPPTDVEYKDLMSRIVSGDTNTNSDISMAFNRTGRSQNAKSKILKDSDFKSYDKISYKVNFDKFGETWFGKYDNGEITGEVSSRIGRSFEDQDEFFEAVGLNEAGDKKQFQINGVVFVKGSLDLSNKELDKIPNSRIGGGVIIVQNDIKLGNITRNQNLSEKMEYLSESGFGNAVTRFKDWGYGKTEGNEESHFVTQDKMLTFVSLSNDSTKPAITVKGSKLIGVHLICLNKGKDSPYTQILWDPANKEEEIVFMGGIACNYLNLKDTVCDLAKSKITCELVKAPFFMYNPQMAIATPSLAVQIPQNMKSYEISSKAID